MRLIVLVLALLVVIAGASFSALNSASAPIDLYFARYHLPVSALVLGSLLTGWLLGGLVAWFGQVPRLQRELRAARRQRPPSTSDEAP